MLIRRKRLSRYDKLIQGEYEMKKLFLSTINPCHYPVNRLRNSTIREPESEKEKPADQVPAEENNAKELKRRKQLCIHNYQQK